MPHNKLASYRYRILDECLGTTGRYWSVADLIERVSYCLERDFDKSGGVSKRTIEADLALMQKPAPVGFGAPIGNLKGIGYYYTDDGFSIHKKGLNHSELKSIRDAIQILKQFQGLPHFGELQKILFKLEGRILNDAKGWEIIQFETNPNVEGMYWIDRLYTAIEQRKVLELHYHPFHADNANRITFHPYLLKEYRNRWFVFGHNAETGKINCLALDRLRHAVPIPLATFYRNPTFHPVDWFKDIVGVTKPENAHPFTLVFQTSSAIGPYIKTKPIHTSQQLLKQTDLGWIFSLHIINNFELRSELMRYGTELTVVSPEDFWQKSVFD